MTDRTTTNLRLDYYKGSSPSKLDPRVRALAELGPYIVPLKYTSEPLLPNNFVEVKGPLGDAAVLQRQAMQGASHGARGMLTIQSYGEDKYVYDNNAYTIASTYNSGASTLKMYTMHPTEPTKPTGYPKYHMNQLRGFNLTDNIDSFREGATWFRNARVWAKEQRDATIAHANATVNAAYEAAPATTLADAYLLSFTSESPRCFEQHCYGNSAKRELVVGRWRVPMLLGRNSYESTN
jgi:hypothetical protein